MIDLILENRDLLEVINDIEALEEDNISDHIPKVKLNDRRKKGVASPNASFNKHVKNSQIVNIKHGGN